MSTASRTKMAAAGKRLEGFNPAQIAGLVVWLRADVIGGLADGAAVASWTDISGNGNHALQATGAKQPVFKAGILNGRPVVRFNGTSNSLVTAAFGPLAQPNTIVAVAKRASTGDQVLIDGFGANRHILVVTSGNWQIWAGSFVGAAAADTNWNVLYALYDATDTLRVNGTQVVSGAAGTATLGGLTLGRWADSESGYLPGDFAEVLVYDGALSSGDRTALEQHLGTKYGITVA